MIAQLATCSFIARQQNVVFLGISWIQKVLPRMYADEKGMPAPFARALHPDARP